jgi:hypothetical protein
VEDGAGDAPMLPELLAQIPPDEALASVSADGAYDRLAMRRSLNAGHRRWHHRARMGNRGR